MSWVTVIWSMSASACLTLAAMHLLVWFKNRAAWASLAFAFAALGVAGTAAGELLIMRSATPEEIGLAIRLTYVPIAVLVVALVGFVQLRFGNGRRWLAWTAVGLQGLALILNFTSGASIVYREIASLRRIELLGEPVSVVARAVANPWVRVDELGNLFLLVFVADASVRLWLSGKSENRRRALRVGGAIVGFILMAAGYSALVDNQLIQSPYFISLPFLAIVLVMGLELSHDVLRSNQLVHELQNSQSHLLASRAELDDQLRFERLVTEISAMLMHAPAVEVEKKIVAAMGRVASMLGFEIAVYSLLFGGGTGLVAYVWNKPGVPGMPANLTEKDFPWKARELSAGRDTHIRSLDDFPPEAGVDRATYERYGIKSSFDVPIIVGGRAVGVFSMGSFEREQSVPPLIVQRQRILGDLFANAILRAQSETALRESERRLNLAAAAANLGLWFWNMRDNSMWATNRGKEIFGFTPETNVTFEMWLERLHPEDRPAIEAELAEAVARRSAYEAEYRILRHDGEVRWIAARGEPAIDPEGKSSSMTGVVRDITARKRAELETQELRRDLAHSSRVTLLGQLVSALAHELGQPLGAIMRNAEAAELILQEKPPNLDELQAIVTDIRQDDQRAGNVISRLRSLLKRRELVLHAVGLEGVIAEVVALVRADARERGVRLEIATAPDLPKAQGDRVHLQQVLLNLIINAMDALMESKGSDRRVTIDAARGEDRQVMVSVSDNGPGIPEDRLGLLFEPFFTTKSAGMGVGLAVSKNLIEAQKGRLWAENRPEGGAVFRFTVPMAADGGAA